MNTKIQSLERAVLSYDRVIVCLSGGVDSSVLLKFCAEILGAENVVAVIGTARYMLSGEINFAKELCEELNVRVVEIDVFAMEIMRANPPDRCYICKRKIFLGAMEVAKKLGISMVLDGTNFDDLSQIRQGMRAKSQLNIISPFADCGIGKAQIRALAREMAMFECSEKASATCLMTRFAVGASVSEDDLRVVEKVESFVKSLGFELVRARVRDGKIIIEVARERACELANAENISKIKSILQELKKDFEIAPEGYKLGFI